MTQTRHRNVIKNQIPPTIGERASVNNAAPTQNWNWV